MKSKLRMRISSIFIAVIMLLNLFPTTVFAVEATVDSAINIGTFYQSDWSNDFSPTGDSPFWSTGSVDFGDNTTATDRGTPQLWPKHSNFTTPTSYYNIVVNGENGIVDVDVTYNGGELVVNFTKLQEGSTTVEISLTFEYTTTGIYGGIESDGNLYLSYNINGGGGSGGDPNTPVFDDDDLDQFKDTRNRALIVQCLDNYSDHSAYVYPLSEHPAGYTIGEVVPYAGGEYDLSGWQIPTSTYTHKCVVEFDEAYYVKLMDSKFPDWGSHVLNKQETGELKIQFYYNKNTRGWDWVEDAPLYIYCNHGTPEPENPSIDSFTKKRLTSAPTDVTLDLDDVTVDYSEPVVIPEGGSVTLLYKLTVTGDKGANFVITDMGATLVGSNCGATQIGNTISGTIPAGGIAALYVTKTFDADGISGGNLTNSASVAAGDDTDLGDGVGSAEESTPAEEEQPPTTPTAPDDDDLSTILGNDIITVECINTSTIHADGTYGLLAGSYTIGSVSGTAQSGYTCDITVQPALYVQEYNETYGDHSLDPASQTGTIQLVWDASENEWTVGNPASVTFTVKHQDVPGAPEGPDSSFDYDLVDIKVSCECTNSPECTHSTQTYDVTDGEYGVSQPTFNSTKDQWEVYVTVSGTQARSYINQAVAVWENPHSGFENVTPPTKLYTLIYNSQYDTWEKDESIEVEFEVACVHQDEEYDLIYDGNAQEDGITANVPTDSTPHYSGQSVELSRQIPTHSNVNGQKVVFRGWSLTDSDKIYAVGETLPATVTEVTFADGDIQVHAVWGYEDTTNPPNEPSEGELSSLLGNVVEIVCDNTNSTHQATLYNLLSNSYTCAVESMDNGNYRCVVTISPAEYVKQYNLDTGANHTLDPVSQGSKSVILSWNDQNDSWEMPAVVLPENQPPFRYTVTCEEISLTYDANGGVFANNSETFVAHNLQQNTAYSLGSESGYTDPTYGTHTFKGWTTDISADGKIYEENETLPVLATTVEIPAIDTVYAVWVEDTDDDDQGGGAHHPDAGDNDDDDDNDRDDDTEEIIDEEVPLAETPWLNTEDHYAYIVGYSEDGTVRPNANITRAEVATIFFRLLTDSARDQFWMTTNNFSDVLPNDWYNTAVSTMVNMGIIQGYEDGTFRPNANITRAEFATIAARFLASGYEVEDDLFTDIANHWARESINDAAMAGWINGYEDGTFRPDAAITRAEAVTMVNNVLQRKPDADHMLDSMIKWPDNPEGTWYYEAIQEATNSHDYDLFEDAEYETWTALQENRDWAVLEKDWANTHLAGGVA